MGAVPPHSTYGAAGTGQGYTAQTFDTTGQLAPAGMKPRVTATLWEDEGSLCFQVEAKGVCVARREGKNPHLRLMQMQGLQWLSLALYLDLVADSFLR